MGNKNSINTNEKSSRGIDWRKTGLASIVTSVALSLGLTLGTPTQNNRNYNGNYPYSHNLKEIIEGTKKIERGEPIPIFMGRLVITHDGEPYEVKDSVKIYFDVDEHFTLNTHVINSKGYKDLQGIIRDIATQKDSSAVVGFDFAKKGIEPNTSSKSMTINSLTGHASPEAIKYEGTSLKIGNIESENIKTAEKRAEIGRDSLKAIIRGIAEENPDLDIDSSSITISGDETQLNEEELKTLENLASYEGYSSVESMIYANERGEIKDKSVSETINKIINTKRNVVVTFTKKGQPDTIYVVPLVLLPILIFKRKKSDNSEDSSDGTGSNTTGGSSEGSDDGDTNVLPPVIIPEPTDDDNGGEDTDNGGNGGGGTIIPPIHIRRKKRKYEEIIPNPKLSAPLPKYNPYNNAFQAKQPWDKREHYFRNERKGNFGRSRSGRTKKD